MRRCLALVLLVVVVGAGCGPIDDSDDAAGAADRAIDAEPVLFIGDSLTVGSRQEGQLEDVALAAGIEADVLAQEGRDVGWAVELVEARPSVPAVVVVELGTNPDADADPFVAEVAELVEALRDRGATTIAWVTPVHRDDRYDEKVAVLEEAAEAGSLVVADWRALVRENPDWFIPDNLHYTDEGYAALAAFLVTTALTLLPSP